MFKFNEKKNKMAQNSNKSNQMAKDKDFIKDYILYDLIIKEENYNLKSLMTNLELNLKKIFKSVTIDPCKLRILCKLNKIDGMLLNLYIIK